MRRQPRAHIHEIGRKLRRRPTQRGRKGILSNNLRIDPLKKKIEKGKEGSLYFERRTCLRWRLRFHPCHSSTPTLLWISGWMNRLCPTFLRVGVSYQPARLTFSRRNHPWPGQHRGDVVGVADSISTHVVDKSLGYTTTQKFISTVASFRWENKVVSSADAKPRCNRRRLYTLHTYGLYSVYHLFHVFGDCRSQSIGQYHNRCHVACCDVVSRWIFYRVVGMDWQRGWSAT